MVAGLGSLVIIAPSFIAILVGVSFSIWLILIGLVKVKRHLLALCALALAFVFTSATAADAVNMHYSYMPRLDDIVGVPTWPTSSFRSIANTDDFSGVIPKHGTVVTTSIPGRNSGFQGSSTFVYLPPQYFAQPDQRFPVIYMLHGTPGLPVDWFRAANAASVGDQLADSGKPALLVAPPVSKSWLDDSECVDRPTEHIEQYVTKDVVPYIDTTFRTLDLRNSRVVAGMSAGGYCALNIGLKHSDMFGSIIDMSGYDRPTHAGGMSGLFGKTSDLSRLVANNTPADYIEDTPRQTQSVWLDSGTSDLAATHDAKEIAAILQQHNDLVRLDLRTGGHSYKVWRPAMTQSFPWALNPESE